MNKVLITGGAGYVGTSLIPQLLDKGYQVRVLDNLMFGGDQLLPFFRNKNFEFQKGDIRSLADVKQAIKGIDAIIHLAAIVGYPACRTRPRLAKEVNVDGTKNVAKSVSKSQPVIYASTGSGYGYQKEIVTEKTPLSPLTLYGQTKGLGEEFLLNKASTVICRFATAFGVSPRIRLDLLVNDFTFRAVTQGYLVVYEKHFHRSFIHVYDMGRALLFALEHFDKMKNDIFNVGSDKMGVTKEDLCELIKKYVKYHIHYSEIGEDQDKRSYQVSFKKINSLGFDITIDLNEGIQELLRAYSVLSIKLPYSNV